MYVSIRSYLIAGISVAGAGLIAAGPIQPATTVRDVATLAAAAAAAPVEPPTPAPAAASPDGTARRSIRGRRRAGR